MDLSPDDITEGPIARALVVLALPLVVQNVVRVAQQAIDLFWVGRLGEGAVAAVGLTTPVVGVVFAVLIPPFVGTQVLVSQRVGGDRHDSARSAVFHGLLLAAVGGAVVGGFVFLVADPLVRLIGAGPEVAPLATVYLATLMLGLPLAGMSDALEGGFVGWGDSRASLAINVLTMLVNVVLDPLLILGVGPFPALGLRGAAIATVLGYAAGFALALWLTFGRRASLSLSRDVVRFDPSELSELVDVGAPLTVRHFAGQAVRVVIVAIVAVVGGAAGLAAYVIGARIASLAFLPATGLQQAAQSVVGQNLGANQPTRAAKTTWVGVLVAAGLLTVVGVAQWVVPGSLTRLFVADLSPAGFALTVDYLRILAYGYPAIGVGYLLVAGFNGARRTRTSLAFDLGKYWLFRLPVAVVALPVGFSVSVLGVAIAPGLGLGIHAVFWAVTGSNVLATLGLVAYYRHTTSRGMYNRAASAAVVAD